MYLMNLSRHHMQHLQQHMMHFTPVLSSTPYFFSFSSTHSRNTRIIRTMVRTREPKAKVPRW